MTCSHRIRSRARSRLRLARRSVLGLGFATGSLVAATASAGDFVEPDVRVIWELHGNPGSYFGWAVAELEDIDGDGRREGISGAPAHDPGTGATGRTTIISGATGQVLFDILGPTGSFAGYAIADAGDVNGDGKHDIISGAPGLDAGHVYVYSGVDASVLLDLTGETAGDFFGSAVASAGDVNGDGHADVLIGAEESAVPAASSGRAYIYSGRDGSLIRVLEPETEGARFGSATAWIGDITGDGVPDQFVAGRDAGAEQKGRGYVYSGATGELVFNPFDAGMRGADLGWFFIATPGDVDGDGVNDLYAGDFSASAKGPATGEAYVYSGSDGALLLTVYGDGPGQGLGPGRGAGDVDGDGLPDIVAGSYLSPDAVAGGGKLSFYSVASGKLVRTVTSRTPGENLGFDAVTVGDVDGDGWDDTLASAASGDAIYLIAGQPPQDDCGDCDDTGTGDSGSDSGDSGDSGSPGDDDDDDDDDGNGSGCPGCATSSPGPMASLWLLGLVGLGHRRRRLRRRVLASS